MKHALRNDNCMATKFLKRIILKIIKKIKNKTTKLHTKLIFLMETFKIQIPHSLTFE